MNSLTDLREVVDVVIGVDTHVHTHSAAVIDSATGAVLGETTVAATAAGYAELVEFANDYPMLRARAIEGTGGHGAGLSRRLMESSELVVELDRPKRSARRNGAKSDPLDAIRAAREAMARPRLGTPRSGGERQAPSVLLGAGGAARAIAVKLALAGAAHVSIANRSIDKANQIAAVIAENTATGTDAIAWDGELTAPHTTTVVVNATSLGLPGTGAVPVAFGPDASHLVVCDVIPNPPDTDLLQRARAAGATTLDGRGMLLNQAAINIALWTGVDPDRTVMGNALNDAIANWAHP